MTWVAIDIETLPDPKRGPDPNSVKAPSNYKDADKIRAYKLENALDQWKKTSLNRWRCQVACVGVMMEGMLEPLIWMSLDEAQVIGGLAAWLDATFPEDNHPNAPEPVWCGHNSVEFDLPILSLRAFRYGHSRLGRELRPGHPKWGDPRHRDTLLVAGGEGKLSDLADFFGIARKHTIGGEEVGAYWATQRYQSVADHCSDDVATQWAVIQEFRTRGML